MQTPTRLRLYQYPNSPYCIPIAMMLRNSGIPYEIVDVPLYDPRQVIELTEGKYYQVPVLEDLFNKQIIYEKNVAGDDIPRYIADLAPLMQLFPEETLGLQQILTSYIENQCEAVSFKVCDALHEKWAKNDLERGLLRRHKERKFGPGCLEEWGRNIEKLIEEFHRLLLPFEHMLKEKPFLTGERPVYADYALCGVIGNFLYPGNTMLPSNALMLEAWYTKMRAGNFKGPLDDLELTDKERDMSATYGAPTLMPEAEDLQTAIADLKLRPGTKVLDVGTGEGNAALFLASKGFNITASDSSSAMLKETARRATELSLFVNLNEHPAEKLPYPDATYGLITCRLAAHYFSSPETFVKEAARALKMYGYLVIIEGTVPDDQIDAYEWMNEVERLRDPKHVRFVPPAQWRKWCVDAGLTVTRSNLTLFKQPDLNWYFNVANTPPENRKQVLELIAKAPTSVRELFKIGQEDGKIFWYWRRMTMIAGKI